MTRAAAPRRLPLLLALLAAAAAVALVFALVPVRSDMTALLPQGRSEGSRLMLAQLRSGVATSLILVGIEGASEEALAGISDRMSDALGHDGRFAFVQNGRHVLGAAELEALFARRYLLSPGTGAAAFTAPALHADFERLLDGLQSAASPLVGRFGLPDPTGAFPALVAAWAGGSQVRTAHGVWFAATPPPGSGPRALLLIRTRTAGMELGAQDAAITAVGQAFDAARGAGAGPSDPAPAAAARPFDAPPGAAAARLLLAGPAVFARDAAAAIRGDVRMVSVASTLLVALLLVWRFRSPLVLAAIAVPVLLGVAAATAVTALRFGFVHGITLGFGMTMLGVTVDYPVLLVGHRKVGEPAAGTLARIGPTFLLAVATAAIGLSGMALASVPGVAQLGLFAVTGLLAAAAATRVLLPPLIVASGLAPVAAGDPALLRRVERWRRFRPAGVALVVAAALVLALHPPRWERNLGALTPIPPASLALDATLRRELGAPEPGQLAVLRAPTAEAVLQGEEALLPVLDRLVADGVIAGADVAARLLPSAALQRARQASLPDAGTLAAAVAQAQAGLPFAPDAFRRFEDAVLASRTAVPLLPGGLDNPLLATRLDALLTRQDDGWLGLVAPRGVRDPARFAAALAGVPGLLVIDVGRETGALATGFLRAAWPLVGGGAAASVLCLLLALRDARRVGRVLAAIASALLVTVALLGAMGMRLSLIHLVSLQFVAGVGLDYALFFARTQVDEEERARTLRTLLTCVGMALLSFGALSLCRTPLLSGIGVTVATGVACAMGFGFLFAGPWTEGGELPGHTDR